MARTHMFGGAVSGLEALEARRLFSAGCNGFYTADGSFVAEIEGSDQNDVFIVRQTNVYRDGKVVPAISIMWRCDVRPEFESRYVDDSFANGSWTIPFDPAHPVGVSIRGMGGDDLLLVDQRPFSSATDKDPVNVPVTLDGGAGDDRLVGGDGMDVLIGGDGADWIDGGASPWAPEPHGYTYRDEIHWWLQGTPPPLAGPRTVVGQDTVGGMTGVDAPDANGAWIEVVPPLLPPPPPPAVRIPDDVSTPSPAPVEPGPRPSSAGQGPAPVTFVSAPASPLHPVATAPVNLGGLLADRPADLW